MKIFGEHDEKTVAQLHRCMGVGSVVGGVLCADGHYGYAQPVGGVVAYEDMISVSGVGFDIACGNMAVRTDAVWNDIKDRIDVIGRDISKRISFGIGRVNSENVEHPIFDDFDAWKAAGTNNYKTLAREQLGTVGSGNHYVDLFREVPHDVKTWHPSDEDPVWIGVHFGSRGLGHKTATKYLKLAGGKDGMDVPPAVLNTESELGQRYLAAMELAGRYAYAGREWVVDQVRRILCAKVTKTVHNHHNFAWLEKHVVGDMYGTYEKDLWVVRKGATPAFPGQEGFVGGSMGDEAVIIEGVDSAESKEAFFSTVHGAGRVMGRVDAKGKKEKVFDPELGRKIETGNWIPGREPRVTREQMDAWIKSRGVYLIGGDVDESPMAYRRLRDVLQAHGDTIRVNHTLKPFLVLMAGDEVRDPYKD